MVETGSKAVTHERIGGFAVRILAKIKRVTSGWVQRISSGHSMGDKLRILCIAVLQSVSKVTKKRIFSFDTKINGIADRLWRGTVIKIDGIKYALLDYESFRIVASRRDRLSQEPSTEVYAENFVLLWLKPRRGDTFVDVGAHIGKYTLTAAKLVGNGGVAVAIEPHPLTYQTLLRNVRLNKLENAVVLNLAAWNNDCELKLYIGSAPGHHSAKIDGRLGWVKVKGRVMDHLFKELGLRRVDWIKIDVEGAECEVLLGLIETLKTYRPRMIIEVFNENVEKVKRFMEKYGYGLVRISPFFGANTYFFCFPTSSKARI